MAIVDVIGNAGMEQKMVVVNAGEMAKSSAADGRVALYGIYFDAGKANHDAGQSGAAIGVPSFDFLQAVHR